MRRSPVHSLLFALALTVCVRSVVAAPDVPVADPKLEERLEVRLVTIDVIALDRQDRTVPNLGKEAFQLLVDGEETPIDTLDVRCGDTPEPDPKPKRFGDWKSPPDLADGTRRVVLALDYLHLPTVWCPDLHPPGPCMMHTQVLQAYQAAIAAKPEIGDEEMMVVALTGGLRVEQPFTRDRGAIVAALRRMEYDITLWNGRFEHGSEYGLFRGLGALATLLRATPGPKSIVLLTAGGGPGTGYDLEFAKLATLASDAQARIYPVDCRGLFTGPSWGCRSSGARVGDSSGLMRFAGTTGGRLTENANDFTVGYARARRDLGCRYTIGFYDRAPEEDRAHRLRVKSTVSGVTVYHADSYSFPSPQVRRGMALQAAYLVPSMFEGGGMRAQVFPIEPRNRKTWNALIAIDFPVPPGATGDQPHEREFGVVLEKGPNVVKQFARSVRIQRSAGRLAFLEPATVSPGLYTLTAVLSGLEGGDPLTVHMDLTIPEIPTRKPFLVGPMLGRHGGADVVIMGGEDRRGAPTDRVGGKESFRPLLVTEIDRKQPLAAFTLACVGKRGAKQGPWRVTRRLATGSGKEAAAFGDAIFAAVGKNPWSCEQYFDEIPVSGLAPGRYAFTAEIEKGDAKTASLLLTP